MTRLEFVMARLRWLKKIFKRSRVSGESNKDEDTVDDDGWEEICAVNDVSMEPQDIAVHPMEHLLLHSLLTVSRERRTVRVENKYRRRQFQKMQMYSKLPKRPTLPKYM